MPEISDHGECFLLKKEIQNLIFNNKTRHMF